MRKTALNKNTIILAVFLTLAAVLFAGTRYFSAGSKSLRAQQETTGGHHDTDENHHDH